MGTINYFIIRMTLITKYKTTIYFYKNFYKPHKGIFLIGNLVEIFIALFLSFIVIFSIKSLHLAFLS